MPDLPLAQPAGLALLAALPVIVWLHLRRRRPRRVVVPSLAPWLVLSPAIPPRRRRIPPTLLLLLHLAAATSLALAVAGPHLPGAPGGAVDRAIVVDVTTSMAAADRWAAAIDRVRDLVDGTRGAATLVTLVTLEARPRVLAARDADGRAVRAAIADLRPGSRGADVAGSLAMAAAAAGPEAEIVVVTDGGIDPPRPGAPPARFEVVGAPVDNLAVVAAAARTEAGEARLFARVASFAGAERTVPVRLTVDGRNVDERSTRIAPGGTFESVWTLPAGARTAEVRIDSGNALPADDAAAVPLEGATRRIQIVGDSPAVARALGALPDARLERAGLGTFHADGSVPVSVFVGTLPERLPPGGVLLVDPEPGRIFTARASDAEGRIDAAGEHPLVADLDLAGVTLAGLVDPEVPAWAETVLRAGSHVAAFAGTFGPSRIVVLAFDPDAGTLAQRLAFPLFVARAVAWSAPAPALSTTAAGQAVVLPAAPAIVRSPDGASTRVRGLFEGTRLPGIYTVTPSGGSGIAARFAVHAGDIGESDLRRQSSFDHGPGAPSAATSLPASTLAAGRETWPWLAGLALVLVLIESAWRGGIAARIPHPRRYAPPPPPEGAGEVS